MANYRTEWWNTDDKGRRIGYLTPEDFCEILEAFYGRRQWMKTFAKQFDITYSTIQRYKNGEFPIPKHVAMIVQMLATMRLHGIPLSELETPWLPHTVVPPEPADAGDTASGNQDDAVVEDTLNNTTA